MWMLKELGLKFEDLPVSFTDGSTRQPEFLHINPNGRIPVLQTPKITLFKSMAINLSLARKYPGPLSPQTLEEDVGDFVLRRREGYIAYQLAVVIDDSLQQVTNVVRGIDLLDSTPRQVWLQRLLGYVTPGYMHLPVVTGPDGEKLSKQTGAAPVDLRRPGETAWRILALLRQAPPPELRGAAPAEIWAWGAANWRPQQLAGTRSIPAP
jgi:glutamyl-Q tRNA(Asp) synthetase